MSLQFSSGGYIASVSAEMNYRVKKSAAYTLLDEAYQVVTNPA